MRMSEIGCQTGQMALDIDALAVPAQQRADSEAVALISCKR